jgi:hypothetical protein
MLVSMECLIGRHLPAGLVVVVADVRCTTGRAGSMPTTAVVAARVSRVAPRSRHRAVGRRGDRARRDAVGVGDDRAFQALLRRSTGLGSATWPPQGAL